MQLFKRSVSARGLTAFSFEILLIAGSLLVATWLYAPADDGGALWRIVLPTGLFLVCLYYNDFYDLTIVRSGREVVIRLFQAGGVASILLALIYVVLPAVAVQHRAFFPSLFLFLGTVLAWRFAFNRLILTPRLVENILIVGTGPVALALARQIAEQHDFGYRVVGFAGYGSTAASIPAGYPRVLGEPTEIGELVARYGVDRLVVAVSDRRGRLPIDELVHVKLSGVPVEEAATTYERLTGKIDDREHQAELIDFFGRLPRFALAAHAQARRGHRLLDRRPGPVRHSHGPHGHRRLARIREPGHLSPGACRAARTDASRCSSFARCASMPRGRFPCGRARATTG